MASGPSRPPAAPAGAAVGEEGAQGVGDVDLIELKSELIRTKSQLALALEELQQLRTYGQQDLAQPDSIGSAAALKLSQPGRKTGTWWQPSWEGFTRGFTLGYGVRAGLSLATKIFSVVRKGRLSDLSSWALLSEQNLVYRVDAVRLGLFCGGYSAVYHAAMYWLMRLTKMDVSWCESTAGALAGLCVMLQSEDQRRTMALYTLARVAQCTYNSLKAKGKWHFWGSDWAHGDWLLFGTSTAQIMFAYVMRPETLPTGYWNFVVNAGPIHKTVLKAVKASNESDLLDVAELTDYCIKAGGSIPDISAASECVPCGVLHPHSHTCVAAMASAGLGTFRKTFPLYMSISLVPYCVFNLKRALKDPATTLATAFAGAVRSTAFLATFVAGFQALVCSQRNISGQKYDHGLVYLISGFVSSLSLLIEKKSRRSELALYVMPRALDSLFLTLTQDKWVPSIHKGEVVLFSACMGALMHYHNSEPETMAPLVKSLIGRIVFGASPRAAAILPMETSGSSATLQRLEALAASGQPSVQSALSAVGTMESTPATQSTSATEGPAGDQADRRVNPGENAEEGTGQQSPPWTML